MVKASRIIFSYIANLLIKLFLQGRPHSSLLLVRFFETLKKNLRWFLQQSPENPASWKDPVKFINKIKKNSGVLNSLKPVGRKLAMEIGQTF